MWRNHDVVPSINRAGQYAWQYGTKKAMRGKPARNHLYILISILFLTLLGCVNLYRQLDPPTIHIVNIEIQEIKTLETIYNLQLRVLNPNDVSIFVKGLSCDLKINDNRLATGVSNEATEIPAFGNSLLSLDVYASALDFVRNLIALPGQETIKVSLKGKLRLEGGSGVPSYLPFESEREFDLKGLLEQ